MTATDTLVAPRSNLAMLAFVVMTLFVTMSISQEAVPPVGSLVYWLLVLPAIAFPLFNPIAVSRAAFSWPVILMTGMLLLVGVWQVLVGDAHSVLRVAMMTLVLAWASSDVARLKVSDLMMVFVVMLLLGIFVYLRTDGLNKWGPFPGLTVPEYGVWRVSFFPNIAYSAFLSLFAALLATRDRETAKKYGLIVAIALFYVATSFVRTALIGLGLYVLMRYLLRNQRSPRAIFWISSSVAIAANVLIAISPLLIELAQQLPFVSRLLLRGETGLDSRDIYIQLFRPWVWWQHIQIFLSSPYLMGWGNFDFNLLKTESLIDAVDWSDTVSMPTRLLASYGLPALLFIFFAFAQLARRARERDLWACACFAPIMLTAMQWGSLFHPSDPMFLLFFLILAGGRKAFV